MKCIFNWESLNNKWYKNNDNNLKLIPWFKTVLPGLTVPSTLTKVWISRIYNTLFFPGRELWLIESESFLYNLIVNFKWNSTTQYNKIQKAKAIQHDTIIMNMVKYKVASYKTI